MAGNRLGADGGRHLANGITGSIRQACGKERIVIQIGISRLFYDSIGDLGFRRIGRIVLLYRKPAAIPYDIAIRQQSTVKCGRPIWVRLPPVLRNNRASEAEKISLGTYEKLNASERAKSPGSAMDCARVGLICWTR